MSRLVSDVFFVNNKVYFYVFSALFFFLVPCDSPSNLFSTDDIGSELVELLDPLPYVEVLSLKNADGEWRCWQNQPVVQDGFNGSPIVRNLLTCSFTLNLFPFYAGADLEISRGGGGFSKKF